MSLPAPISAADRILASLRSIILAQFPRLAYGGLYEYQVVSISGDGTTADITPTDPTIGHPAGGLTSVPLRLGSMTAKLVKGSLCLVQFINSDPTRPAIVDGAPIPTQLSVDASTELDLGASAPLVKIASGLPAQGAARVGDAVGPFVVTTGSLKTFIG